MSVLMKSAKLHVGPYIYIYLTIWALCKRICHQCQTVKKKSLMKWALRIMCIHALVVWWCSVLLLWSLQQPWIWKREYFMWTWQTFYVPDWRCYTHWLIYEETLVLCLWHLSFKMFIFHNHNIPALLDIMHSYPFVMFYF